MELFAYCIARQHDHGLLLAVALVCSLGAYTTASLVERAAGRGAGPARQGGLLAAGGAFGCTVWATHFVAMLAYRPGLPVGYDLPLTALSVVVAVGISAAGFATAGRAWRGAAPLGGGLTGLGIAAMHYTGMAALEAQARLEFRPGHVAASVLAAVALSAPAAGLALGGGGRRRASVAILLALAVLALHFTAMAAVVLVPDPLAPVPSAPDPRWLAAAVTAVAVSLLALCLGGSLLEQNLALRTAEERRLRDLADAALEGIVIHERGLVLTANRAFAALVGRPERELAGADLGTLLPAALLAVGPSPALIRLGAEDRGGDGLFEVVARPFAYQGKPATVLALRDLSAQQRAEAALRQSEERLRLAVEATGLGIFDVDAASGTRRWSDEFRAILGLPPDTPADLDLFASLIHPDDRVRVDDLYRRAYDPAGGGRYDAEFRVLRAGDGAERWVRATGRVLFGDAGRPARAIGTLADVTERRRAHEALRESEGRHRALVETSPDAVFAHRGDIVVFANTQAARLFGAGAPAELVGRSVADLVDPSSLPLAHARTAALTEPGALVGPAELAYRRLDGTTFPVEVAAARVLLDGRPTIQVVCRDLTARKAAEAELRRTHERLARHMDNTPLAVVELACRPGDDEAWRVEAWSGQAEAIFGWAAAEATGRTLQELAVVHEADRDKAVLLRRDLLGRRLSAAATLRGRTRAGEVRHCRVYASVVPGEAGRPEAALLLVEDMTDRVAAEESAHRLAHHDELTGLPNRLLFQDRLGQALARARREGGRVGVTLLDLDHFKEVNDTLGHGTGDTLLREVAGRLRACAREGDTWARLGGDEFALVQVGLREPGGAEAAARRVLETLAAPFRVEEEQELDVGASLGLTVFPDDGETPERLVRNADVALYRAKAAGRGRFRFYRPEMDRELRESRSLQRGLKRALEAGGLRLVYQPVFELPGRRARKVEALLRWPHPGGGLVPPSVFIPVAEASGLIRPLGEWVLREACRQAAAWGVAGTPLKVAVNVSAAQLRDPGLPGAVRRALDEAGLGPGLLELELTEGVFLDPSKELILGTLREVARLGVTLAIDDFGTGYSSLAYLKHFPFHAVKVDRSFVADIGREPGGEAIAAAVVALAHSLGKRAIAEGVETREQLAFLRERGCDAAQGFLLGRPVPADEVGRLLLAEAA